MVVFLDARNSRKLVQHVVNFNGCDSRTGNRRQQDTAQGVSQRHAVAALQRFHHEFAISVGLFQRLNARHSRVQSHLWH